ncbi:MAG: sulfatase-like hydrolase/transferase [Betaproteobacteria bacterium]|nr:sulfatase-like hydrolase/transferase [Betaproteobacteria bacterium]
MYRNGNAYFPAHEKLVTRLFADAGYDCGLVGKLHLTAAKYAYERPDDGYRSFLWSHHPHPDFTRGHDYETWLRCEKNVDPVELYAPHNHFCGPGVAAEYHQTTWVSEMAIRFINEKRDTPWLLSLNPFDPHAPFDAPPEYLAAGSGKAADAAVPRFRHRTAEAVSRNRPADQGGGRPAPAAEVRAGGRARARPRRLGAAEPVRRAGGQGELLRDDHADRRPVEAHRRRAADTGQLDNTIIVFHERPRRTAGRPRADLKAAASSKAWCTSR